MTYCLNHYLRIYTSVPEDNFIEAILTHTNDHHSQTHHCCRNEITTPDNESSEKKTNLSKVIFCRLQRLLCNGIRIFDLEPTKAGYINICNAIILFHIFYSS